MAEVLRRRGRVAGVLPRSSWPATLETSLIVTGLALDIILVRHGIYGDGARRFRNLSALLGQGIIDPDKYSLVGSLFSAPLWFLGRALGDTVSWTARYNSVLLALGCLAFYLILRRHVSGKVLRRFLLIIITASMFPNHVKFYYAEVFTALCVGVGLAAAVYGPALGGWLAVAVGVANVPATLVGLGFAAVKQVIDNRKVRYLLAPVAAVGMIMSENLLKSGNPLVSRYESGFTYPWVFGVLSILFSFGEGLIFFAPGLLLLLGAPKGILAANKKLAKMLGLWIAFLVGMIVVYGQWYDWSGSWFWGPRFFLFASLPASLALALRLEAPNRPLSANLLTLGILLLSCWVGINGALFGTASLDMHFQGYACTVTHTWRDNLCFYAPELSVLWQPFIVATGVHWNWASFTAVEQIGVRELIWTAYSLGVFSYLIAPVLRGVVRQLVEVISDYLTSLHRTARLPQLPTAGVYPKREAAAPTRVSR